MNISRTFLIISYNRHSAQPSDRGDRQSKLGQTKKILKSPNLI